MDVRADRRRCHPGLGRADLANEVERFRRATVAQDQRRLDELRLFSSVAIRPHLEDDGVVVEVAVSETLRLLPTIIVRVTDENGVSAGVGARAINLLGRGTQSGRGHLFRRRDHGVGGVDRRRSRRALGASRRFQLFDAAQRALRLRRTRDVGRRAFRPQLRRRPARGRARRASRDRDRDLRRVALAGWRGRRADVRRVRLARHAGSSTNPRTARGPKSRSSGLTETQSSWTVILDGRRFQRLSDRHGSGCSRSRRFRPARSASGLPEYLQFALGGANSVRGWSLGSRRGRNQFIGTLEYTWVVQPVTERSP